MPKSALPGSTKIPTAAPPHEQHHGDEPEHDRHGFRGLPPPAEFDLAALAGSALLNERETAATLRISTNTLGSWRRMADHPLKWLALPNGFIRYEVAAIRAFLALGRARPRERAGWRKPPPSGAAAAAKKTTTEIPTKENAAPPRRAPKRRAKAEGAIGQLREVGESAR